MTAPTFTNLTANGASSATSFTTASITPTGNRLILISVHAYINTGSVQPSTPTVTGNGITYDLVASQDIDNAGTDRATLFVFRGMASSPTAGAVTISFGATTMTRCVWAVDQSDANVTTQGTNGSGAIYQSTGVTVSSGTTASVNFVSTMESKNAAFSAWGHQTNESLTPRSGWTELADAFPVTLSSIETQYLAGSDTAGSATWTTSSRAGGIILEIAAAPVLLAAYNFDEASGNVLDVTGNGRGFAISGNTIRTASGHTNKGLTQTAAATAAGPSLTGWQTPRRTWMTWIKFAAAVNGWILEFHQNSANTGVWGLLDISGTLRFRAKDSTNTAFDSASISRNLGTWQHIAATYDGANIRVYIGGSLFGTIAMSTGIWTADLLNVLDQTGSDVILDDVRFYDAALDAATITTLMNTPVSGGGSSSADAALTGTATLSAGASSSIPASASLSATVSASAAAAAAKPAAGTLSASTTLTADATVSAAPKLIDAALSVTASLAADETIVKPAGAALTVSATTGGAAVATKPVNASLAITDTGTATGATGAVAALNEQATLTAAGTSGKPLTGSLAVAAGLTATLSTAGQQTADAILAETATLTGMATSIKPVSGALNLAGALAATGVRERVTPAGLSPTTALSAAGVTAKPASATTPITATLIADVTIQRSVTAQLSAVAVLTTAGNSFGGITYRPAIGATSRPDGGTTIRPFTGTTLRP